MQPLNDHPNDKKVRLYISEALRAARLKAGLTQQEVAEDLGIDRSNLRAVELHRVRDSEVATLQRYARALDRAIHFRIGGLAAPILPLPEDPDPVAADRRHREELLTQMTDVRKTLGISQADVARRMGYVNPQAAWLVESGRHPARVSTYQRYIRAVGGRLAFRLVEAHPVDEIAIELALAGDRSFDTLSAPEKVVLFRDYVARAPLGVAAERLRIRTDTAAKWRAIAGGQVAA